MHITGASRLAGVIGWPVSHSRSPLLHNHWLERYGVDGAYVPLPVRPGDFRKAVYGLQAAGFRGVNVTIPHKEEAFAIAEVLDHSAQRAGAVNTLVFSDDGKIHGYCTDGEGFIANLSAHGLLPKSGETAMLLGAGGACRAIAAALLDRGVKVSLSNRTYRRAQALAETLGAGAVVHWEEWQNRLGGVSLLVNTTSLGMQGAQHFAPDLSSATQGLCVADIVYVPQHTPLLAEARARGLRCVGGLGMLLYQACLGFEKWFGIVPAVDEALEAMVAASLRG